MDPEPQPSSHRTPTKRPTSTIAIVLVATLIAAVLGAIVLTRSDTDATLADEPVLTEQVAVERGNISVRELLDGTVEESDTITVVHRIEGQTPVTTATTVTGTAAADAGPVTIAASGGSATPAGLVTPDRTEPTSTAAAPPVDADTETTILTNSVTPAAVPPVDTTPPTAQSDKATTSDSTPIDPVPTDTTPTESDPIDTTPTDTTPDLPAPTTTEPQVPSRPGGAMVGGGSPAGAPDGALTGSSGGSNEAVKEMITGVTEIGTPVSSGDVLYTVESRPVIALSGALPAWRTMNSSSDDGADIAQLEAALVALGYDPDGDVTIDTAWDSHTTAMVKRWQLGLGADETGEVTLGSVVFIPHPAAVTSTRIQVGDEAADGDIVLELSGTVQQVIVEIPTELRANVTPSMQVDIAGTPGTVTRLRSADGTDDVTVQAVITPDVVLDLDAGSTTKVAIAYDLATDQLVVPTEAILSRLDGTYAVQALDAAGTVAFITIDIVAVSGNRTAVTGDGLTDTTIVLTPA